MFDESVSVMRDYILTDILRSFSNMLIENVCLESKQRGALGGPARADEII